MTLANPLSEEAQSWGPRSCLACWTCWLQLQSRSTTRLPSRPIRDRRFGRSGPSKSAAATGRTAVNVSRPSEAGRSASTTQGDVEFAVLVRVENAALRHRVAGYLLPDGAARRARWHGGRSVRPVAADGRARKLRQDVFVAELFPSVRSAMAGCASRAKALSYPAGVTSVRVADGGSSSRSSRCEQVGSVNCVACPAEISRGGNVPAGKYRPASRRLSLTTARCEDGRAMSDRSSRRWKGWARSRCGKLIQRSDGTTPEDALPHASEEVHSFCFCRLHDVGLVAKSSRTSCNTSSTALSVYAAASEFADPFSDTWESAVIDACRVFLAFVGAEFPHRQPIVSALGLGIGQQGGNRAIPATIRTTPPVKILGRDPDR
jgi:hypothetical protein